MNRFYCTWYIVMLNSPLIRLYPLCLTVDSSFLLWVFLICLSTSGYCYIVRNIWHSRVVSVTLKWQYSYILRALGKRVLTDLDFSKLR